MKFKVGDRVIFSGFDARNVMSWNLIFKVIPDTKGKLLFLKEKHRGCIQKCRSTWSCEEYLVRFNNQESWLDKDDLEIDQQWIRDEKIKSILS